MRIDPGLPRVAGTIAAGGVSGVTTAMSFASSRVVIVPVLLLPSANVRLTVLASATTWRAVMTSPWAVTTTPVPSPADDPPFPAGPVASMSTIDGAMAWYTSSDVGGGGVCEASALAIAWVTSVRVSAGAVGRSALTSRTATSITTSPAPNGMRRPERRVRAGAAALPDAATSGVGGVGSGGRSGR